MRGEADEVGKAASSAVEITADESKKQKVLARGRAEARKLDRCVEHENGQRPMGRLMRVSSTRSARGQGFGRGGRECRRKRASGLGGRGEGEGGQGSVEAGRVQNEGANQERVRYPGGAANRKIRLVSE